MSKLYEEPKILRITVRALDGDKPLCYADIPEHIVAGVALLDRLELRDLVKYIAPVIYEMLKNEHGELIDKDLSLLSPFPLPEIAEKLPKRCHWEIVGNRDDDIPSFGIRILENNRRRQIYTELINMLNQHGQDLPFPFFMIFENEKRTYHYARIEEFAKWMQGFNFAWSL